MGEVEVVKILVVDDERMALESAMKEIHSAVEGMKAEIRGFRRASEALVCAKEKQFDIAFLDMEMREMNGLTLAEKLKETNPQINIIFNTGYAEFAENAFRIHASGYCLKPVTAEKIKNEMKNLRYPLLTDEKKRMKVVTFGNFEVFVDGKPLKFQYNRTKELLAYLIDRNGALCSNQDIMEILWEDDVKQGNHSSYMKNLRADLFATLTRAGCGDVFVRQRGMTAILPDKIECDYFDFIAGKPEAVNAYRGEYMVQYSWSEYTHGLLETWGRLT